MVSVQYIKYTIVPGGVVLIIIIPERSGVIMKIPLGLHLAYYTSQNECLMGSGCSNELVMGSRKLYLPMRIPVTGTSEHPALRVCPGKRWADVIYILNTNLIYIYITYCKFNCVGKLHRLGVKYAFPILAGLEFEFH